MLEKIFNTKIETLHCAYNRNNPPRKSKQTAGAPGRPGARPGAPGTSGYFRVLPGTCIAQQHAHKEGVPGSIGSIRYYREVQGAYADQVVSESPLVRFFREVPPSGVSGKYREVSGGVMGKYRKVTL